MYLAAMANPLTDDLSFEDFKIRMNGANTKTNAEPNVGLSNKQMQKELDKAEKMLNSFVPPIKGGG